MNLKNMVISEVSLVDKAANKRKFLLYKRDNGGGEPVKIKLEDIAKMSEADLRKALTEVVGAQAELEKSVADFDAKVKKAADETKSATDVLVKRETDVTARETAVKAKEDALSKQDETMECSKGDWTGPKADLKDGKCPKCGASAEVKKALDQKAVDAAVEKAKTDLIAKHAAEIKERDDVIDELVKSVEILQKSTVTKSDVEGMIKTAVETFKKNLK